MEIPEDIQKLMDLLRAGQAEVVGGAAFQVKHACDTQNWPVVGKLTSEEILEHKTLNRKGRDLQDEAEMLRMKLDRINTEIKILRQAFWAKLNKAHSLPEGQFHLNEKNQIQMMPTGGDHDRDDDR